MKSIVFATTSRWKIEQARKFLERYGIAVDFPPEFEAPPDELYTKLPGGSDKYAIEIQSDDFEKVAQYKALSASRRLKTKLIVEDIGISIESLRGFPGPYTKYAILTIGVRGVLALMHDNSNRNAEMISVVGYCEPGSDPKTFVGKQKGTIAQKEEVSQENPWKDVLLNPIFVPEGEHRTLGQIFPEEIVRLPSYPMRESMEKFGRWYNSI